ncbi:MAG: transketolase [Firmicutes bacterium]|nr:transketolase [Bacillota bacterium]
MTDKKIAALKKTSINIKRHVIESTYSCSSGHPGGSLSITDILSVLYFSVMNVDTNRPKWEDRDRLVLSKGHTAPALYGALAEKGFFGREELSRLRQCDSFLQGHPDMNKVPGIDMSTGSLGQGLSAANGMAIAGKYMKKDYHVFCILGDGESQEGQVWEAAMTAAHYKLDNIIAFLDHNGLQIDGAVDEVMSLGAIDKKFEAFGWHVIKVDGHDIAQLLQAVDAAKNTQGMPTLILCKTIKGQGVSFMENRVEWHGAAPNKEQRDMAIAELEQKIRDLEVLHHAE